MRPGGNGRFWTNRYDGTIRHAPHGGRRRATQCRLGKPYHSIRAHALRNFDTVAKKNRGMFHLHIAPHVVELCDPPSVAAHRFLSVLESPTMNKLLILTALTIATCTSIGCCGDGLSCFRRRNACPPPYEQFNECDPCAEGAMGGPILTVPMSEPGPMVMPGPG